MKNIRKEIKTSYSISVEKYLELENAAILCGVSTQNLIRIVMAKYVKKLHKNVITEDNVLSYNKHGKKGFKRIYIRLSAKEYSIIFQLKFNTRYSSSYLLTKAIENCLSRIVMAILRKKKKSNNAFFRNSLLKLEKYFVYWPNIETEETILPFYQMHLDYLLY